VGGEIAHDVQLQHFGVAAPDDEQRRRAHTGQCVAGEVRPAAARHDGGDRVRHLGRRSARSAMSKTLRRSSDSGSRGQGP
jgi:hypothetical protein